MAMPLNACGVGTALGSAGVRPDRGDEPVEEWLPAGRAASRVGRSDGGILGAAKRGEIRWQLRDGRMVVSMSDVRRWSDTMCSRRRTVLDRRPTWFSHLPGPAAQADAATLARQIVGLRNEYEAALRTFPEAAIGYLVEAEMLLDERSRLLRQPGALMGRAFGRRSRARREDVA